MFLFNNLLLKGKYNKIIMGFHWRCFCEAKSSDKPVRKYVYISQSTDIYTNLALEDWLYTNMDFSDQEILMLWRNKPCVVIGRHQNPWLECNVDNLESITPEGVKLARRNSGGGTVYHDEGNLNLTFFMSKVNYNRKHNLQIISRALFREYNLKADISEREDLVVRDYKVSGTAAKLGRKNAYHHCTLLINSNKDHLHQALQKISEKMETRATQSIKSQILNLKEENPKISTGKILKAIGHEFLHSPLSSPMRKKVRKEAVIIENGFQLINPTEVWFPGINEIEQNLKSWNWIFGKCPEFSITRQLRISDTDNQFGTVDMKVEVVDGIINGFELIECDTQLGNLVELQDKIHNRFKNEQFSGTILEQICNAATKIISDIQKSYRNAAVYT